jgi:hypothetical protein
MSEKLEVETASKEEAERAERIRKLERMFSEWTAEDALLSDEDADCLRLALAESRGLTIGRIEPNELHPDDSYAQDKLST